MRAGSIRAQKEKIMVTRTPRGAAGKTSRTPAAAASATPAEQVVEETVTAVTPPTEPVPEIPPAPVAESPATVAAAIVEETKEVVAEAAPEPVAPKTVTKVAKAVEAAIPAAAQALVPAFDPKSVEQAVAYTKEKVEKMSKQVFTAFDDVAGFHKENVDAFVASSTILAKGFEALSKELMAFTQGQYEQSVTTAKALMGVKSVKELVDLQTEFAKTSFDALVAEATKVSETGFKVANQAAEPITARVNATVEKLSKIKAAA
jgi:phasin family protein